jgi:outer membrane protein TolC
MSRAKLSVAAAFLALGCTAERYEREDERARFNETVAARTADLGLGPPADASDAAVRAAMRGASPGRPLSLDECEAIALKNNLAYRTTLLATRLRDEQVRGAFTAFLPKGDVEFTAKRRSNEPLVAAAGGVAAFEDRETTAFSLSTILPIFDFGATWFAWSIAKDERTQERLAAVRARQTLLRDVRVAYVRVLGALKEAELLAAEVAAAKEETRAADALVREGLSAEADAAFVSAQLARAERDETLALRDVLFARSALARTMSIPVWTAFNVVPDETEFPAPPASAAAVRDLEQRALLRRPEVRSQDYARNIAAARVKQEFAAFFPRLDGTFDFDWSSNSKVINPSFFTGGIKVAHALLDGGATFFRHRAAGHQADVEKERALLVAMGVVYEVDLRVLELIRAADGLAAGKKLAEAQERLFAGAQGRSREGMLDGAGLARALADRHSALRDLNRTRTESLVAWHELRAAVADDATDEPDAEAEAVGAPAPGAETAAPSSGPRQDKDVP